MCLGYLMLATGGPDMDFCHGPSFQAKVLGFPLQGLKRSEAAICRCLGQPLHFRICQRVWRTDPNPSRLDPQPCMSSAHLQVSFCAPPVQGRLLLGYGHWLHCSASRPAQLALLHTFLVRPQGLDLPWWEA